MPGMASARRTYLVSVRDNDGPATLEEIRTGRKIRLGSVTDVGTQIERWLGESKLTASKRRKN
jgi:hypothetical protein